MKKILSLILFTLALVWTWSLIHSTPAIGFETHAAIQEKLALLIVETLQKKKPNAQNIKILKLWSEAVDEHKLLAHFSYQFTEPTTDASDSTAQAVEGQAVLHREPSENQEVDHWIIQSIQATSDSVSFSEGTVITPNTIEEEQDIPPAEPSEQTPTHHK